jgi:hypothetical protein
MWFPLRSRLNVPTFISVLRIELRGNMSGSAYQVKKQQASTEEHTFVGQVPVERRARATQIGGREG